MRGDREVQDVVVGIDLGTTNSEIAAWKGERVQVLGRASKMLPSVVGLSSDGRLLVGEAARNQQRLHPERTVRSIKRKMGSGETVTLGDRAFTPPEISALILRELVDWARRELDCEIRKAVITVPAYFTDSQRSATREAGELAGLEVLRIVNEPTAASLAYGFGSDARQRVLVYDLGGGTFDVSVVMVEGDVTEVMASHGNNRLGGDDFDALLVEHLCRAFAEKHAVDPRTAGGATEARLWWAAEEAKKKLSAERYVQVREEALMMVDGRPLHLDVEVSREAYEDMIRPLLESTLDSVSRTLQDARLTAADLDAVLLVGGSTRTPMVAELLARVCGLEPRQDVDPDLTVALGAGVLASRLAGHDVDRILVDVSPFSFGPSFLGLRGGFPYPHCYRPIIKRNTPLPVTRTESYCTSTPYQTIVEMPIFQGDDEDALKNVPVGDVRMEGVRAAEEPQEILCRMALDLDGILRVSAVEKETGKAVHVSIEGACRVRTRDEIARDRKRLESLFEGRVVDEDDDELHDVEWRVDSSEEQAAVVDDDFGAEARALVTRSQALLDRMHADDMEEAIDLHEAINEAISAHNATALEKAQADLRELLFFVEAK